VTQLDLLVVGSGVAGLSAAVRAAGQMGMSVGVVSKSELDQATTRWAQGGVAAALSGAPDEIDLHLADTIAAGAGLCDLDAVRVMVDEGPARVHDLIALGARFDADDQGELELAREGGHSVARVIHAGGAATGAEIERALVAAVRKTVTSVHEESFAIDLLIDDGRCQGVRVRAPGQADTDVLARNVLLATGGAGQLYAVTTNPTLATGDGVAMALRAGVAVADLEFFQFHPTALHHPSMPRPLLSEALRGHGAVIRDAAGDRFVDELLPRDQVARAITATIQEQGLDHVWLDATKLGNFAARFPTIQADLASIGLDPSSDLLPVAPAAHHQCGGIVTDLHGATTLRGLWAAGETTCSGVHGANRLASNSLLEGMVFASNVVEAISAGRGDPEPNGAMRGVLGGRLREGDIGATELGTFEELAAAARDPIATLPTETVLPTATAALRAGLQQEMTQSAGVLRSGPSILHAAASLGTVAEAVAGDDSEAAWEVRNLAQVGIALLAGAAARRETRGAHARTDFPELDPDLARRLVIG
jgi:L-aspartate oxidase